jgi:ArsR family transcriptional regulator
MLSLLLRHGELCVCDFVAVLGISQSKASRHLRYLRNSGLLDDRRDGVWIHYRVARMPDDEAAAVLSSVKTLISRLVADELDQRLKNWLRSKQPAGTACRPRPAKTR